MRGRITLGALTLLVAPSLATAQTRAQPVADAEQLFQKGLTAMKLGNYRKGCPALAESVRLDRRPGALFTLAECYARWGKISSAIARYDDYLSWYSRMSASDRALQEERYRIAKRKKKALSPHVPMVRLRLPQSAPPDVAVILDGTLLERPALGIPLPVDPGTHQVVVRAGGRSHKQSFQAPIDSRPTVALIVPKAPEPPVEPSPPTPAPSSTPPPRPAAAPPPLARERGHSAFTYAALGVGAAGIVVGSTFGILAWTHKSAVNAGCRDHVCNHEGKVAADQLQADATWSTVGFGAGLAGLALGGLLFAVESHKTEGSGQVPVVPYVGASATAPVVGARGMF